jgi:hypothetical protein
MFPASDSPVNRERASEPVFSITNLSLLFIFQEFMQIGVILRQSASVPARHLLVTFILGSTLASGFWLWSRRLPIDYVSSALLSYENPHHFLSSGASAQPDTPTVQIADSILPPPVLKRLADQLHFAARPARTESPEEQSGDFRSHFELIQPAPGLLQITYRGNDEKQVTASVNALAGVVAAWVPKPPESTSPANPLVAPVSKQTVTPSKAPAPISLSATASSTSPANALASPEAAVLRHRIVELSENSATLALQRHSVDHQISDLLQEKQRLQSERTSPTSDSRVAARPPGSGASVSATGLSVVIKNLAQLRMVRATLVAEEESNEEQLQKLRTQAAAGAGSAAVPVPIATPRASDMSPAKNQPTVPKANAAPIQSWQGSFSVVAWGEKPHPLGDDQRRMLLWLGIATSIVCALLYFAFAAWRFRAVQDLSSLRAAMPRDTKYLGAVAGSPLTGKAS